MKYKRRRIIPLFLSAFFWAIRDNKDIYTHAEGYSLAYWELGEFLRSIDKWGMASYPDAQSLMDAIREKYFALRQEYHLPQD